MRVISQLYRDLRDAKSRRDDAIEAWHVFQHGIRERFSLPQIPAHFSPIMSLAHTEAKKIGDKARVRILDHGSGSGRTVFVLRALGFHECYGIDLSELYDDWNAWLLPVLKKSSLLRYDGTKIPFEDQTFDFVFSQQVVEHLQPSAFANFFSEEARVLRPNGIAYHQVPHRLAPYDSHTRTWFLHYLPRPIQFGMYNMLGLDGDAVAKHLFLRMPGGIRRAIETTIGPCRDISQSRFADTSMHDFYDGPIKMRRLIGHLSKLPLVGRAVRSLAAALMMREFIATRRS